MSIEISPSSPAPRAAGSRWWSGELFAALVVGAGSLLAGVLVGLAWRYLAPTVQGVVSVSDGQKSAFYADPETKGFVGQDGVFAICGVVAAVLLAIAAFARLRRRGPVGAALALGGAGFGAAHLASWLGSRLGPGHGSIVASAQNVPDNGTFDLPLRVGATGVIWLWPAVAVGLYFLLMLVFGPEDADPAGQRYADARGEGPADPAGPAAPGPRALRVDADVPDA